MSPSLSRQEYPVKSQTVRLDEFDQTFGQTTELSSVALGARVSSVSDDFFAEASNLITIEPALSMKGQFGPNGALFSGWESRRHNPTYDWCIIKLGTAGKITGFDIDTSHFNGNEAPEADVQVLFDDSTTSDPTSSDPRWKAVLPRVALEPNSRHLFSIPLTSKVNWVKLNMYPDGGIARFRAYGHVLPVFPADLSEIFDLAHVFAGAHVQAVSDQHFGASSNLINPGRGKDMGDGWETKRSRAPGHKDWVIIRLGTPGILQYIEIDTAHFMGNYPQSCTMHAILHTDDTQQLTADQPGWTQVLSNSKLGPHRQHYFQLENVAGLPFSHVKVTIFPDGGLKRVRVFGRRLPCLPSNDLREAILPAITHHTTQQNGPVGSVKDAKSISSDSDLVIVNHEPDPLTNSAHLIKGVSDSREKLRIKSFCREIPILPLTPEAFSPFGQVIQAYEEHNSVPRGTKITPANQNTASKFHKLSLFNSSYPFDANATTGVSVYRCQPLSDNGSSGWAVVTLERHPFTKQCFIPMGAPASSSYLVVVAGNQADGSPDVSSLRAFVASGNQGICYETSVWHQPMAVFRDVIDFACFEAQIGDGSAADCEIIELPESDIVVVKHV